MDKLHDLTSWVLLIGNSMFRFFLYFASYLLVKLLNICADTNHSKVVRRLVD